MHETIAVIWQLPNTYIKIEGTILSSHCKLILLCVYFVYLSQVFSCFWMCLYGAKHVFLRNTIFDKLQDSFRLVQL